MEQEQYTIEEVWALEYNWFADTNNVWKDSDVYSKDEIPCIVLISQSET